MTVSDKAVYEASVQVKMELNKKLYQNGVITKAMYEYAKAQLLKR